MASVARVFMVLVVIAAVFVAVGCGDEEPATTSATAAPGTTAGGNGAVDAAAIYAANCVSCHGQNGEGGVGTDLRQLTDADTIEEQVRQGGGGMPAFDGVLTDEEIEAVSEYVVTLGE